VIEFLLDVFDPDTKAPISDATVTVTVTDASGGAVGALTDVAMPAVGGTPGRYRAVVAAPGLTTDRRYPAVATVTRAGLTLPVHGEIEPRPYTGANA
jgi:hypothetical protein